MMNYEQRHLDCDLMCSFNFFNGASDFSCSDTLISFGFTSFLLLKTCQRGSNAGLSVTNQRCPVRHAVAPWPLPITCNILHQPVNV